MIKVSYTRSKLVAQANSWIGRNESDSSHEEIIDVYNGHGPLARGYKVKYTDAWCATFVSACAIKCGYTEIIPTECSCERMIALYKDRNRWVENDAYMPSAGDIVFYDWQDNGTGDNKGHSDHVGIVEKVSGNTIVVIEGNYSNAVKRRTLKVNGQYIRGYGIPKYDDDGVESNETPKPVATAPAVTTTKPSEKNATSKIKATDPAKAKNDELKGSYRTTANLNMRNGAGTTKKVMVVVPKNVTVQNWGYYTEMYGTKWLYVQVTLNGKTYTGFCSSKYLDKI